MPPTCTPEKKNEYQNEQTPSESNELYFTTNEAHSPRLSEKEENDDVTTAEIIKLAETFPDLAKLFNVHRQVGYGTFSTVYLASLKTNTKKQFAVKHIVPTCHPDRIKFELQCLKDIGGTDNVAGISLCLRNQNDILLIMPYQPHNFFNNYVGEMDVDELAFYMKNLLIALARVHSFGIVHRDIKPSNFLYDRTNKRLMLVDFGLAHSVSVNKEAANKKRKREASPIPVDVTQPLKKLASSTPLSSHILGMSQKENDPSNKPKEIKIEAGNTSTHKKSELVFVKSPTQTKDQLKQNLCRCYGKGRTCSVCITKRSLRALRAGTPGFRPPEVLLKSNEQDTGVDVWAAGIIMLSILSNCNTFFSSPDDMTALVEIMIVFGSNELKKIAHQLGRHLICSENCPPLDLRKVCCVLRARDTQSFSAVSAENRRECSKCRQQQHYCLCIGTPLNEKIPDKFSANAYDLLSKLLDINMRTRISAADALKHPFLKDV